MAAALPELQDAYPAMYQALTVGNRYLSLHDKECVWLGVLIACQEHVGTHHILPGTLRIWPVIIILPLFRPAAENPEIKRGLNAW